MVFFKNVMTAYQCRWVVFSVVIIGRGVTQSVRGTHIANLAFFMLLFLRIGERGGEGEVCFTH